MTAETTHKTYLVGGAVRDALLGLTPTERDWVLVGADADELLSLGYTSVGRDFPVFLHPDTREEYALARKERKKGHGYSGFECDFSPQVTLEEDLLRRDLTINAIAQDADGQLIDPYGGLLDIERRVLRHVSEAFGEDPLRVLRVARFAARFAHLGFSIAPETLALMRGLSESGELDYLVAERVWQETRRALESRSPQIFFSTLRECGALATLFPEIDRLFGVPQSARWHPEIDTGIHLMLCLEQAARWALEPMTRFGVLVHDLGKGSTPEAEWPKHIGHESRGADLCRTLCERLKVPAKWREFGELLSRHHTRCHDVMAMKPAGLVRLIEDLDGYRQPERLKQFLIACEIDSRGRTGFEDAPYPVRDRVWRAYQHSASISARDLDLSRYQGPAVGAALHQLRCEAVQVAFAREG